MVNAKTVRWLIVALVVLISTIVALVILTLRLNTSADELSTVLQTVANEQALVQDQQILAEILDNSIAEREELFTYIIDGDDGTVAFLSDIDQLAAQAEVTLSTVSLNVVGGGAPPYDALAVSFSITGREADVLQLIEAFEVLPYASTVTSLSLGRSVDASTGAATMSGTVSLELSITSV